MYNMKSKNNVWWDYCIYIKIFSENTTLHGFKYLVSSKLSSKQRLIWSIAMLFTIIVTCCCLWETVLFAQSNLLTTNIDTMQLSIEEVEFPSVSVCSFNHIRKSKADAVMKEWNLPPYMDREKLFSELKILPLNMIRGRSGPFVPSLLTSVLAANKMSVDTLLYRLAVPCEDLMVRCEWKNIVMDCNKMFRLVKSYTGYCCAFNNYADVNSTVDVNRARFKSQRMSSTGYRNGLVILIKTNITDYYSTMYGSYGAQVFINRPWSYIDESSLFTVVKPTTLMLLSYIPSTTITSKEALELHKSERHCIHGNEKKLALFKIYTYKNCIVECRINITDKYCDCVLAMYPRHGTQRVCDLNDLQCLASHQAMINSYLIGLDQNEVLKSINSNVWPTPCNCKPLCFSTRYSIDTTTSRLNFTYFNTVAYQFYQGVNLSQEELSLVYVFPQDLISTRDRSDVYYSTTSLLGSFGSFLSFFLGFNMVCVAEVVCFLIIQPCLNLVKRIDLFK